MTPKGAAKRGRGQPRKPDEAYRQFFQLWLVFWNRNRSLPKKTAWRLFLAKKKIEIERLGFAIGKSASADSQYKYGLAVRKKGKELTWSARFAHLRQSDQWKDWEEFLRRPPGRRGLLFIKAKSFGE